MEGEERSTRQVRHVMSKEEARKFSSILSLLCAVALDYIGGRRDRKHALVKETADVLCTIFVVEVAHKLVGVPNEVDVKRWHHHSLCRRGQKVQEPLKAFVSFTVPHVKAGNVRVISTYSLCQDDLVVRSVEISWDGPTCPVHLLNERILPDDSTDEIRGERPVVGVGTDNSLNPWRHMSFRISWTVPDVLTCGFRYTVRLPCKLSIDSC